MTSDNPKAPQARTDLHDMLKQAPAAIAILKGKNHVFEYANPLYMQLIGQNRDVLEKPLIEALPEIKEQGFVDILDKIYTSGQPYTGAETRVQLDQQASGVLTDTYLNFTYQPIKNDQGEVEAIFVHVVDITEQVRARQKIQESEEKYRSLFEAMDQGFCIIEMLFDADNRPLDYRFLEINPTFEEQTGLKDAIGKTARELVPNLEQWWFDIYGGVALTGEPSRFIEGSDVMGRWFDVYAFRLGGAESRKVALLFTDITERKKAEEERSRLLALEHAARQKAEQSAAQITLLQALTSAFAQALRLSEIVDIVRNKAVPILGAQRGAIFLLSEDGEALQDVDENNDSRVPLTAPHPAAEAVRTQSPVWPQNFNRFPHDTQALACIPLFISGKIGGVIEIAYAQPHAFDQQEYGLLGAIADQCAQAIDRIRLYKKEQELVVHEERNRLARELHDAVSQALFSANVIAEALPLLWKQSPEKSFGRLQQLHKLTTGALAEMRTLLLELRPENVVKTKLDDLITQLANATQSRRQIDISLRFVGKQLLPEEVHHAIYRITQEALNNAVKHSHAANIKVSLKQTAAYTALVIADNGQGFTTETIKAGFGVSFMHERAANIGALLSIKSDTASGTRVRLLWKMEQL